MKTRIELPNEVRDFGHWLGIYKYGSYCYEDNVIYLYIEADENEIITTLNHEYLHAVIHKLIDEKTSRNFDKIFYNKKGKFRELDEWGLPFE